MATADDALVEVEGLKKYFDVSSGVFERLFGTATPPVRAVDDVSFSIEKGDVMGIAGESGCGKTTLGKVLVQLYEPTEGTIRFDGEDVTELTREEETEFRQRVQMIFQDPFESLNPRMTVYDAVSEPLRINDMLDSYQERREKVVETLNDVGLAPGDAYLDSFPQELSGGERQRVAIARAMVVDPEFVVCDEPVSMLDVSIRAGVLNLMKELRDEYGLTYLFISHDLSLIRYMCNKTAIMYLGDMVEYGPTDEVVDDPKHPYSEALFDAVPVADPTRERKRANVTGDIPSPRYPPEGCKFHTRCANIIPPESWDGTQDAFRRVHMFKRRVLDGLSVDDLDADPEATPDDRLKDQVLSRGLALTGLPEEYALESEREMAEGRGVDVSEFEVPPAAQETIEEAASHIVDGDTDAAADAVRSEFVSICETDRPANRAASESVQTACHLYGEGDEPQVGGSSTAATADD
ncbi:ABC transporter ATP-binding protein [Haloparvum sp. AD34]